MILSGNPSYTSVTDGKSAYKQQPLFVYVNVQFAEWTP